VGFSSRVEFVPPPDLHCVSWCCRSLMDCNARSVCLGSVLSRSLVRPTHGVICILCRNVPRNLIPTFVHTLWKRVPEGTAVDVLEKGICNRPNANQCSVSPRFKLSTFISASPSKNCERRACCSTDGSPKCRVHLSSFRAGRLQRKPLRVPSEINRQKSCRPFGRPYFAGSASPMLSFLQFASAHFAPSVILAAAPCSGSSLVPRRHVYACWCVHGDLDSDRMSMCRAMFRPVARGSFVTRTWAGCSTFRAGGWLC